MMAVFLDFWTILWY